MEENEKEELKSLLVFQQNMSRDMKGSNVKQILSKHDMQHGRLSHIRKGGFPSEAEAVQNVI
jgi:hypothetical protein